VTSADFTPLQNSLSSGATGYLRVDGTLDGEATSADFTPLQNALVQGASSQIPATESASATSRAASKAEEKQKEQSVRLSSEDR